MMSSEITLRRKTISKLPIERCSSRTEIAINANDINAPPIHRAARIATGIRIISLVMKRGSCIDAECAAESKHGR